MKITHRKEAKLFLAAYCDSYSNICFAWGENIKMDHKEK
jgi:hypothetical protein